MDVSQRADIILEMVECAVHQILYARKVYPEAYFEKRAKYSMKPWRCKSAEVSDYVTRVLVNTRPLLEANVVEEVVMSTSDSTGSFVDQIAFKIIAPNSLPAQGQTETTQQYLSGSTRAIDRTGLDFLEAQLQSLLLQLSLIDDAFKDDYSWDLCVILKPNTSTSSSNEGNQPHAAVQTALQSQQWIMDSTEAASSSSPSSPSSPSSSPYPTVGRPNITELSRHAFKPIHSALFQCQVEMYKKRRGV